jgi:hypothetical protein
MGLGPHPHSHRLIRACNGRNTEFRQRRLHHRTASSHLVPEPLLDLLQFGIVWLLDRDAELVIAADAFGAR